MSNEIKAAVATRIGNSRKETIAYGDTVIRKSVDNNKYNFLALVFLGDSKTPFIGASATRANASKWTPGPMSLDIYPTRTTDSDHERAMFSNRMFDAKKKYGEPKKIRRNGCTFYRFDRPFTRRVVAIERKAS